MNIRTKSPFKYFVLALSGALLLTACGPSGDPKSSSESSSSEASASAVPGQVDKTVEITANDQMKFGIESFTVNKGSTVKIHLKNIGTMPKMSMGHNVVVLKRNAVEKAFVEAAMQSPANDYIPKDMSDVIVAHTKMTGGGEEATVTFKVPNRTGNYTFLCSFPGHYQVGMKGTMVVQ